MKVLNLYAGIGGNRKLWPEECEVTAIENNKEIAKIYRDFFPKDKVIVTDAHQYLLDHYKEFDFIWSSRPCKSHSRAYFWAAKGGIHKPCYPDLGLYEEIIFLENYYSGKYVVENVNPYYIPLRTAQKIGRHYFWANFRILNFHKLPFHKDSLKDLQKFHGIDISKYKIKHRKDQILRNCVNPKLGLHIFKEAFKVKQMRL